MVRGLLAVPFSIPLIQAAPSAAEGPRPAPTPEPQEVTYPERATPGVDRFLDWQELKGVQPQDPNPEANELRFLLYPSPNLDVPGKCKKESCRVPSPLDGKMPYLGFKFPARANTPASGAPAKA